MGGGTLRSKYGNKAVFRFVLIVMIVALITSLFVCYHSENQSKNALSSSSTISGNLNIGELYDSATSTINAQNFQQLLNAISSSGRTMYSNATIADLNEKLANNSNTIKYSNLFNGYSITVQICGMKWYATYVSKSTRSGADIALTLWLTSSTQSAFAGGVSKNFYTYNGNTLTSQWSAATWSNSSTTTGNVSNCYGKSCISATALAAETSFAAGVSTTTSASSQYNTILKKFTTNIKKYSVTPFYMAWQSNSQGSSYNGVGQVLPNEALDYSTKQSFANWRTDVLWLPSLSEVGYGTSITGIWGLPQALRKDTTGTWLRSTSTGQTTGYYLTTTGSRGSSTLTAKYGVRPCLTLNVSSILNSLATGAGEETPLSVNVNPSEYEYTGSPITPTYTISAGGTAGTSTWDGVYASSVSWAGVGTIYDPYIVDTASKLSYISKNYSNPEIKNKYFKQTVNINLNNKSWNPINGTSSNYSYFYDGNGYAITGLNVNRTSSYSGFFGRIYCGYVKNLTLQGSVKGGKYTGGLVGYIYGSGGGVNDAAEIQACYIDVDVVGTGSYTGGIVGYNLGGVKESVHDGRVQGTSYVGGLFGYFNNEGSNGALSNQNCYHTGAITGSGSYVYGLGTGVANGYVRFYNCFYNTSTVANSNLSSGDLNQATNYSTIQQYGNKMNIRGLTTSQMTVTTANTIPSEMNAGPQSGSEINTTIPWGDVWKLEVGSLPVLYNRTDMSIGEVTISNNIQVGTATISVAVVDWDGTSKTATGTFKIVPRSLTSATITAPDAIFNPNGYQGAVAVVLSGKTLTKGTDYTLLFNTSASASGATSTAPLNVGTYYVVVVGSGNYTGTMFKSFIISPKSLNSDDITITIDKDEVIYDGTPQKPNVNIGG